MNVTNELISTISKLVMEEINRTPSQSSSNASELVVKVGVSARHVHLSRNDVDILFGKGYELNKKSDLMGGQYSCQECVTIVGSNLRAIENVRILAPIRKASQVEIAKTDAIKLGITPPIRESGNLKGSSPITIVGPRGAIYLPEGCIVAMRHIHMSDVDAQKYGLKDKELINIKFDNERSGILLDVLIRVDATFTLEMHIDTDEANGLGVRNGDMGIRTV